jgi:Cu/Ag efflux protein CusF
MVMALVAMVVVGFASLAVAGEKKASKASSPMHHKLVGEVTNIDATAKTFTVKEAMKTGEAKEITFTLGEHAKVMIHEKPGKIEDVKAGDSVTVKYMEKDGKNVAEECMVAKPKAAA